MQNAVCWFDIPTTDMDRAKTFYETVFGFSLIPMDMPGMKMLMFPVDNMMAGVGGALIQPAATNLPGVDGPTIYLDANPDLQVVLDKVEAAGGRVVMPKTQITPEIGYMGMMIDSEGNKIGLHSAPMS